MKSACEAPKRGRVENSRSFSNGVDLHWSGNAPLRGDESRKKMEGARFVDLGGENDEPGLHLSKSPVLLFLSFTHLFSLSTGGG